MPNYEKLTLEGFKLKLAEGKYESLTGARRAIGKVTDWSAKDKQKAQELAAAHFGESGDKPAVKTPKKAAKAGPKKAATAPKKVAKKAAAKAAPAAKPATKVAAPIRKPVEAPQTPAEYRTAASDLLNVAGVAVEHLQHLRNLNPQLDVAHGTIEAKNVVETAISFLNRSIQGLPHPGKPIASAVPRIDIDAVKEETEEPAAEAHEETVEEVQASSDEDLTPEEQHASELLASKAQSLGVLGLPRPV